jgi:hypothetical protein
VDDSDFLALPPHIALRVLFDCLDEETVGAIRAAPKREAPKRAKYDMQIFRSGGHMWASETDLEGLRYWHAKYLEGSKREGNQYAAKDAKRVEAIAKWIAWREWYPDAVWSGTRGDEEVVAAPPSGRPRIHARSGNGQQRQQQRAQAPEDFNPDDY